MRRMMLIIQVIMLLFIAQTAMADISFTQRPDVSAFINDMVKKHQFKKQELVTLFSKVKIHPQVMRHINKPLEKETWQLYQMLFVNEWRIKHGVEFWNKYDDALRQAEAIYGIPASIIVATIGIETKYGQRTGDYRVLDSLSNIAFSNSKRAPFFRKELEQFLLLTREEHLDPLSMRGSYAGAIGQPQFMPSSYRRYAVNFSGSGKIDLMNDEIDVIGSIANYYKKHGWTTNSPVATQAVMLGDRYNYLIKNNKLNEPLTIAQFSQYGIVPKYPVANENIQAELIELQNHYNKEYWLGFHNFFVIKRYNASDLYAMAIYQLSNSISALRTRLHDGSVRHV